MVKFTLKGGEALAIRDDAKKIIQYILENVISLGGLDKEFTFGYDDLINKFGFESKNYCRVCYQYLLKSKYISTAHNDYNVCRVYLKAEGIDFLEST